MRNRKNFNILLSIIFVSLLSACAKDETSPSNGNNTSTGGNFSWIENGSIAIIADSAYFDSQFNTIKAFKNGGAKFIEINLSGSTVSTYNLGTINALSYLSSGAIYSATSGSVTISANASSKISGTFTSTGSGASITSLSGSFTDISVR